MAAVPGGNSEESGLKALASALQADLSPATQAVQALLNNPSPEAARALIERLPALLPDDPEMAAILEEDLAAAFGDEVSKTESTVANKAEKCPDCGQWLTSDGVCNDCHKADVAADEGKNPDKVEVQNAEIGKGKAALKKCLEEQVDVYDALARSDLGTISFIYGDERRGIAHFAHREETLKHLPETIIRGVNGGVYEDGRKCNITYGDYTAVLRLQHDGKEERWVVTAFRPQDQKEEESPR